MSNNIDTSSPVKCLKPLLIAGAFVLLVVGWLNLKVSLNILRTQRPAISEANYSLPGPQLLRAATLNFRPAAADLVWIDGVAFVAKNLVTRQESDAVSDYAKSVVALDPYFYKVYSWHSASRMLAIGYPSPEDIEVANDLLEEGMRWFPTDWHLPYEATANYIGFNKNVDTQTRIRQLKRGIKFAEAATSIPGSPAIMPGLTMSFRNKLERLENEQSGQKIDTEKSKQIDRDMLIHLYAMTTNEQARQSLLNRLRQLDGTDELTEKLQKDATNQKKWLQSSPRNYLPYDLFSAVENTSSAKDLSTNTTMRPLNEQ